MNINDITAATAAPASKLTVTLELDRADHDRLMRALRAAVDTAYRQPSASVADWLPWRELADRVQHAVATANVERLNQRAEALRQRRHERDRRRLPLAVSQQRMVAD